MTIAVLGARGSVGKACMKELNKRDEAVIPLLREDALPENIDGIIVASPIEEQRFEVPIVDCSGALADTTLVLPSVRDINTNRMRIPNCMASLIAQALSPLHEECKILSIYATCLQSVSGAGWRGVDALEKNNTEKLFGGQLQNNILPHEHAELEEGAIEKDLNELFDCEVTATSFRVPVFVSHLANLQIRTESPIVGSLIPESPFVNPRALENNRDVAIGRVRIQKNTADLVVCGDQLLCGTAIPAVTLILGA